ncbi:hypothetical protein RsTz2092_00190 [Deferribacterales bacterium RsTz2092]|nr:hypothetical protein AGMMS49941_00320 [Deferribacterales bacterium]
MKCSSYKKFLLVPLAALTLVACGATDPSTIAPIATDKVTFSVPSECQSLYQRTKPIVAVVEFANNTATQGGQETKVSAQSNSRVGVASSGRATYIGAEKNESFDSVSKVITPMLGEFAQGAVESTVTKLGSVAVVSRNRLSSVLKEQQFQMAMADPNTMVSMGGLLGAQYIVTGSVDYINSKYTEKSNASFVGKDGKQDTLSMIANVGVMAYNATQAGWNVETQMTISVIDVSTGQVTATYKSKGTAHVGELKVFTTDQMIDASKKAMEAGLNKAVAFFNDTFGTTSYINEIRGGKKMALIGVGKKDGISKGDKFQLISLDVTTDARTGRKTCSPTPTKITLTASEFGSDSSTWATISGDAKQLENVKIGSLVRRSKAR